MGAPLPLLLGLVAILAAGCGESAPPTAVASPLATGVLIATTALQAPIVETSGEARPGPVGPVDQSCAPSVARPAARLDLCHEAYQVASEPGSGRDRYLIRVYGSIIGEDGSGVAGWLVRLRPVGETVPSIVATWPRGSDPGPCRPLAVELPIVGLARTIEEVCGTTTVLLNAQGAAAGEVVMTWACPDCPPSRRTTLGVTLYVVADVPDGARPAWEIRAAVGP